MDHMVPLPHTVSCLSKIQTGFTFLVPAHPISTRQRAVRRVLFSGWTWSASTTCHFSSSTSERTVDIRGTNFLQAGWSYHQSTVSQHWRKPTLTGDGYPPAYGLILSSSIITQSSQWNLTMKILDFFRHWYTKNSAPTFTLFRATTCEFDTKTRCW